ncbi:PLDc N-terminal domain-containing protein [Leifsonia sp. ZF2019]|uniref:PLDc N-terminal domain-containing protein n=1 Tax=Leifsonia sp. ZF2019 TaxID=2781978 RepID=UPI001CC0E40A|nr:PLDc N-terminal domain-containing protein [Leifsonia sp. ZF2019]UAJ80892.1 PLDc N-terminal domain-containing protein [Leifsonia sp. ZF2019]
MEIVGLIFAGLAGAFYLAALAYAVMRIAKTEQLSPMERIIWIAAVIAFPLAGPIVWFLLGPRPLGVGVPHNR